MCLDVEAVSTWTHSPLTHDKKTTKQTKALTYAVRIIAVGDHEPNASFGKVVERLGVIVGLVAGSLLEKVVEAPASNEREQTRRAYDEVNSTQTHRAREEEAAATPTVYMSNQTQVPTEIEETTWTSGMIELDLPKLRARALERAPSVARAVGDLVDAYVQRGHYGKPVFGSVRYCNGSHTHTHTHKVTARLVGRGRLWGLCAPARFGALSMATQQA